MSAIVGSMVVSSSRRSDKRQEEMTLGRAEGDSSGVSQMHMRVAHRKGQGGSRNEEIPLGLERDLVLELWVDPFLDHVLQLGGGR